jgi:hypothetical protein
VAAINWQQISAIFGANSGIFGRVPPFFVGLSPVSAQKIN